MPKPNRPGRDDAKQPAAPAVKAAPAPRKPRAGAAATVVMPVTPNALPTVVTISAPQPDASAVPEASSAPATEVPWREARAAVSRTESIREAAYRRYAARGFTPGDEVQDWLDAEAEMDGTGG